VANACWTAAIDRMRISAICLGTALLLALTGLGTNRHRRQRTLALS
jgi:hypothetical protein